jgi:predicted Fe-Mo cluster-binding NifX family protein
MRIAVPLHQGKLSEHFGGAESFAFYTVDEANGTVNEQQTGAPPAHERGVFPMWLRQQGATVVLAGGMGPRAAGILAQHGIKVVLGVRGEDPDAVVRSFLDGTLDASGEACQDHGFHDCGHHHHESDRGGCGGH